MKKQVNVKKQIDRNFMLEFTKDAYDLVLLVFRRGAKIQKIYRPSLLSILENNSVYVCYKLKKILYTKMEKRLPLAEAVSDSYNEVKYTVDVLNDLKAISGTTFFEFGDIFKKLDSKMNNMMTYLRSRAEEKTLDMTNPQVSP